jgi:regulator of replication initiation timing
MSYYFVGFNQSDICKTIQALKKENEELKDSKEQLVVTLGEMDLENQALHIENDELKAELVNLRDWCHEDSDWYKHLDSVIEKKECVPNCNFCYTNPNTGGNHE